MTPMVLIQWQCYKTNKMLPGAYIAQPVELNNHFTKIGYKLLIGFWQIFKRNSKDLLLNKVCQLRFLYCHLRRDHSNWFQFSMHFLSRHFKQICLYCPCKTKSSCCNLDPSENAGWNFERCQLWFKLAQQFTGFHQIP